MSLFRRCLMPAVTVVCVVVSACSESPTATISTLNAAPGNLLQMVRCNVDGTARTMECAPAVQTPLGIAADLIVGGQNTYIKLTSSNVTPFPGAGTDSVVADVTVQNLMSVPLGTSTGLAANAAGVNVFFVALPGAPVTVGNPTGTNGTFSAAGQTFYQYVSADLNVGGDPVTGQLVPTETSSSKHWRFVTNGQATFSFTVAVSTPVPAQDGVLRVIATSPAPAVAAGGKPFAFSASDRFNVSTASTSSIQHFDGATWTAFTATPATTFTRIHGIASNDVWVVGDSINGTGAQIRHYTTGTSFTAVSAGAAGRGTTNLKGVFATSSSRIYAVGAAGLIIRTIDGGTTWSTMTSGTASQLNAIWGASDTDIWAVGNAGAVTHWDGANWTATTSGAQALLGVWGSSGSDIWAVGNSGTIRRCTGGPPCTWAAATSNTTANLTDVYGASSSAVWAVGSQATIYGVTNNSTLLRFNGTAWSNMISGSTVNQLNGVFALSATDIYIAGAGSTYRHGIR